MKPALVAGEPAELRLLVPACAAWLAAGLALSTSAIYGLLAAVVLAVGGVVATRLAAHDKRPLRTRIVAAALLCAAGAAAAAAWRVGAVQRGPLPRLARAHAAVTLTLVVSSDPHISAASQGTSRPLTVLSARAVRVVAGGKSVTISSPVVVLATSSGWLELGPTQRVTAAGRLMSPTPGELISAVFNARGSPTQVGGGSFVQRLAGHVRAGLQTAASPLPSGPRGLLPGLVDGDTSGLPPDLVQAFRTTGLTHIVAVSGANVAIVLGVALAVARFAGAGLRAQAFVGAMTIVSFVIVARPQASVLRAAAMGLVAVLALASGRRRRALPALCAAVLCLIYVDPTLALSVGFALSVVATGSLLVLAPRLRMWMATWLPGWLAEALAVPTAATLACAPLIASISGQVSLSSIPANLLAEPAVAPATILGVVTAGVAPLSMSAARLIARIAGLPCGWLVFVARTFSKAPAAAVTWPSGAVGAFELLGLLVVAVAVLAWLRARRRARSHRLMGRSRASVAGVRVAVVAGVVAASGFVIAGRTPPRWPPTDWVLATCNVGATAAVAVRTGPQEAVLIDTGSQPPVIDRCLHALDVQSLPMIVLTGGTSSAVGGLPGALRGRRVGAVDMAVDADADASARVRGWATVDHVAISTSRVQLNAFGDVRWQVIDDAGTNPAVALAFPGGTALIADRTSPAAERLHPDVLITADAHAPPAGAYRAKVMIDAANGRDSAVVAAGRRLLAVSRRAR